MSTTYSGKDLEDAINQACTALNVPREQLDIQVVAPGSPGIFGLLRKKAVIAVTPKGTPSPALTSPRLDRQRPEVKKSAAGPRKAQLKKEQPSPINVSLKAVGPDILAEIKMATEKILSLMGYTVTATLSQENGKVLVQLSGEHMEAIIGAEGSNLDALQYLVRKIVSQRFSEKVMLSMDAGDFRTTRKNELRELALEIARIVKEGGKPRIIAPLNPAERRIIHVTLQTDKTIRSKSIGEGLFKKIKVYIPGQGRSRMSSSGKCQSSGEKAQ